MINKKNKQGELTTTTIVVLVILVASVIVVFLFWNRLGLAQTTNEEICRNSVISRTNLGSLPLASKESIPLQCKTTYVCLTKDGSCETMTSPKIMKVKTKEDVYYVLAEQMANCWWMFGEGKLDYVGKTTFTELMCSLCYQTGFDNSVGEIFENNQIDKNEFYSYLSTTNISSSGVTYLDYLVGLKTSQSIKDSLVGQSFKNVLYTLDVSVTYNLFFRFDGEIWSWAYESRITPIESIPEKAWFVFADLSTRKETEIITELYGKNLEEGEIILFEKGAKEYLTIVNTLDSNLGNISIDKTYFVTMGIFSKVDEWQWAIYGAVGALGGTALAIVTGGISIPATVALIVAVGGGGGAGYFIGTAVQGASGRRFLSPTIIEANSEDYKKLKCESIKTLA